MDLIKSFITEYGTQLLYAIITAFAGYIGVVAKKYISKWLDTKEKKAVARECVQFVEQVYKELHGPAKLSEALKTASQMLTDKGITVTDLELRVLIESALSEFNDAFNKTDQQDVQLIGFNNS